MNYATKARTSCLALLTKSFRRLVPTQTGFTSSKDSKSNGKTKKPFYTYEDTYGSSGHSHFFTGTWMWLYIILGSRERGQRTPPEMKQSRNILKREVNTVSLEFIQIRTCHSTTLYSD